MWIGVLLLKPKKILNFFLNLIFYIVLNNFVYEINYWANISEVILEVEIWLSGGKGILIQRK